MALSNSQFLLGKPEVLCLNMDTSVITHPHVFTCKNVSFDKAVLSQIEHCKSCNWQNIWWLAFFAYLKKKKKGGGGGAHLKFLLAYLCPVSRKVKIIIGVNMLSSNQLETTWWSLHFYVAKMATIKGEKY